MSGLQPAHLGIVFLVLVLLITGLVLIGRGIWIWFRKRRQGGDA